MKFDSVLKGGFVFDPQNGVKTVTDIGILRGKVAALGDGLSGVREWDVSGKTVLPGVIDMHVHVTRRLGSLAGYHMAAASGVSTIIDYAGPMDDILDNAGALGCGLNVGCLPAILPENAGANPTRSQIRDFLERALAQGALGLKILGGHYPLTPEASGICVEECNSRRVFVAWHAGSTSSRSNIYGMREALEYAGDHRLLLAHVNAYCRGNCYHYLDELKDAFQMLESRPNIIADSHMAINNGTSGACDGSRVLDQITQNCLRSFGYSPDTDGLAKALADEAASLIAPVGDENVLLKGSEALKRWDRGSTSLCVSFPVNLPAVAAACLLERKKGSRDFLIDLAATDGGGFPRNGLLFRLLNFHRLGYLSLDEVVSKCSSMPAKVFALKGKGHLAAGADADIAVVDMDTAKTVMTFAMGKPILENGRVVGHGAVILTTPAGEVACRSRNLPANIIYPERGNFYDL